MSRAPVSAPEVPKSLSSAHRARPRRPPARPPRGPRYPGRRRGTPGRPASPRRPGDAAYREPMSRRSPFQHAACVVKNLRLTTQAAWWCCRNGGPARSRGPTRTPRGLRGPRESRSAPWAAGRRRGSRAPPSEDVLGRHAHRGARLQPPTSRRPRSIPRARRHPRRLTTRPSINTDAAKRPAPPNRRTSAREKPS